MEIDKRYCMSSFLMYRRIVNEEKMFCKGVMPNFPLLPEERTKIWKSEDLHQKLKQQVEEATKDGKAALALSGGIDSAILAKYMPKGSVAYTFKCVVPGIEVIDETKMAAKYAEECGLEHRIIEIYWEDFELYAPVIMKHKGAPIHSIEVQIYKAALQAKKDGFERLIYGESADCLFGGFSQLLAKQWRVGDFIDRYAYVMPYKILRDSELVLEPVLRHEKEGYIDPHTFMSTEFYPESARSYLNASELAEMNIVMPFSTCIMAGKINYNRIRKGENKYLVRDVFSSLYEGFEIPQKTPMPRPMNEWLKDWSGPERIEFYPHCVEDMSGDQKWLVWSLEKFLAGIDGENI